MNKNVKSFALASQDYFFLSNDVKKSVVGQKPEINTNISSPEASVDSGRGSRVGLPKSKDVSKRNSNRENGKFVINQLNFINNNLDYETEKRFALCFNQVIISDNNENVARDKIGDDDEEDANIPEDENDHIDSVQLERPKS